MGAFFLYDSNSKLNISEVKSVFDKKGFRSSKKFKLGNVNLLLYKKQLIQFENYIKNEKNFLCTIGTVIVPGCKYRDSLKQILDDFKMEKYNEDYIGNYCIIFYNGEKIIIRTDDANVQQLFSNQIHSFISSSFISAVAAVRGKLHVNKLACKEKLLTGYIVGRDTLFNEIIRITQNEKSKFDLPYFFIDGENYVIPKPDRDRINCIKERGAFLTKYVKDIEPFANENNAEIGLSGGYDSRLLYAATLNVWVNNIDVHTHSTEGVGIHDEEKEIVKSICKELGNNLTIIPTKKLDSYSGDEIEKYLLDGMYFFDGRCAYNMGAFSPTYTRMYKVKTANRHFLTLNGLGGEVYRNYLMLGKPKLNRNEWMKNYIYADNLKNILSVQQFEDLNKYVCKKMEDKLGFHWPTKITKFEVRRYYSEMREPICDALNCNAHNQISFYLTPFIEKKVIEDAYCAKNFIGIDGDFQAELIKFLYKDVAKYQSHYGFAFDQKSPLKHKLYMLIRGWLPDKIWNARVQRKYDKSGDKNLNLQFFERTKEKCEFLSKASEYIECIFPEINFNELRKDYAMMPCSSYIAVVLYYFRNRIV